ncbi:MAG: cation:proton antiporter [Acidimicrobiia bacterium]
MTAVLVAAGGGPAAEIAARVFLAVGVIVVVARAAAALFRHFGQPAVLGEIVAGIALGPSLLGLLPGDLPELLFPLEIRPYLTVAAELGLVMFMFVVGLEIDPDSLRRSGRRAVVLSLSSIAMPMLLGAAVLTPLVYDRYGQVDGEPVSRLPFALFVGVAMSGTAFAVLARILTERNMFRIPLGMLAIACAAIDDIVVFALLTLVVSLAGASAGLGHVALSLVELAVFAAVLFGVVRPLLDRFLLSRYRSRGELDAGVLAVLLALTMVAAWVAHLIGLASLIGAFLFGACVPRRGAGQLAHQVADKVEGVSVVVLLPVFFVATGLGVDIGGLGAAGLLPLLGVMATACIGKFVGGGVAARLMGVSGRQSLALATLMNTRGLTELVILNVGRSAGLIDGDLFTMMVIMAVVTTVAAGPLLSVFYPPRLLERDIADADRRRAGQGARYRVAVVLDADALADPARAAALGDAALAAIGPDRPAEAVLLALLERDQLAGLGAAMAATQPVRAALERAGVGVSATVRLAGEPAAERLAELQAGRFDAVLVGWSAGAAELAELHALARADVADLLVVAGGPGAGPDVDATAPGAAVAADVRAGEAVAVAEHAARRARHGGLPLRVVGGGRAARGAAEQLQRAGYDVSVGDHSGAAHPITVRALLHDEAGLSAETVAAAASATSPLLLVAGRQGDRPALHERVPRPIPAAI